MHEDMHSSWKQSLASEFEKEYFKNLSVFVSQEYAAHTCYPAQDAIFAALNSCPFDAVRVVIIGQDPYHGAGQANGLSFSVNNGVALPPSLINIFKELTADIGKQIPKNGNLEYWASQGVLLLNATLTVRAGEAGSHQKRGWEQFTDAVIETLSRKRENIIFLLWGGYAKKKGRKIDVSKHHVLTSGHPSPLSANRGYWFGNCHFSKTNELLEQMERQPIKW